MNCSSGRSSVSVSATVALLFFSAFLCSTLHAEEPIGVPTDQASSGVEFHGRLALAPLVSNRKLLREDPKDLSTSISSSPSTSTRPDNIGNECTKDDILVHQGATASMPNGIPTYTVEILNVCLASAGSCSMAHIHLSCGWFSSARLINPRIFRRLAYDDCLLNDGRPLPPGSSISFQYANSYRYPMSIASASCVS